MESGTSSVPCEGAFDHIHKKKRPGLVQLVATSTLASPTSTSPSHQRTIYPLPQKPQGTAKPQCVTRSKDALPQTWRHASLPNSTAKRKDRHRQRRALSNININSLRTAPERSSKDIQITSSRAFHRVCLKSSTLRPELIPGQILATDPSEIQILWQEVKSQNCGTMPPKNIALKQSSRKTQGSGRPPVNTGEIISAPPSINSDLPAGSPVSTQASETQTTASRVSRKVTITPRDLDFREEVLTSRGILVDAFSNSYPNPHIHFGTPIENEETIDYSALRGMAGVSIWLSTDEKFLEDVVREYRCMVQYKCCEAEFATFAKERLLKREPRFQEIPEDRQWRSERTIELVTKPEADTFWPQPPIINGNISAKTYGFDVRPDCSYWLSLQAFNSQYVAHVEEWAVVVQERMTCPYFTIEFKRDGNEQRSAENQVAAAGALALYNRYKLKHIRVTRSKRKWQQSDALHLRHYGLTFAGARYTFWCLKPTISEDGLWQGCLMQRIFAHRCNFREGVKSFANWVNEIHRWGLQTYGPACERDIKKCLGNVGFRVSLGAESEDVDEDPESNE